MPETLADQLLLLPVAIPTALVPPSAFAGLIDAARHLPAVTGAGFERHLGGTAQGVDLAVAMGRLTAAALRRAAAVGDGEPVAPDDLLVGAAGFRDTWLELDLVRGARSPSVFAWGEAGEAPAVVDARLRAALQAPASTAEQAGALDRLGRLAPPARVFQIGLMRSRRSDAIRVCVEGCAPATLGEVLAACGRPGDGAALSPLLAGPAASFERLRVGLELLADGTIAPRFGLELAPARLYHDHLVRRWLRPLSRLVAAGLCTPEEERALVAWHGAAADDAAARLWPRQLDPLGPALAGNTRKARWGLHHLKLVVDGATAVAAKAYFGFILGWEPAGA